MQDWQGQFQELRGQFIQRSVQRIQAMESLIDSLSARPADVELMKEVRQHFHWLAGAAGTYQLVEASQLGARGESIVQHLLDGGQDCGEDEADELRNLIRNVRRVFAGEPAEECAHFGQAPSARLEKPPAGKRSIFLVDGDQANLLDVTRRLEDNDYFVHGLRSAAAAAQALKSGLPDAVIISVPLPDNVGYDLAQYVRRLPGGDRTPVVILSRQSGFLDKVTAIRSGADAYFDYPLVFDRLIDKMKSLLDVAIPQSYRVLSVEDEPDHAAFIKSTLESVGYTVCSLQDPKKFEETFLAFQPDLVLLDVMLGDMNGFELAQYIRQNDDYVTLPVLFLTTQNALEAHVRSAKLGGDDHLIKPVPPQLLIAAVSSRLERARLLKKLIERDGLTRCLTQSAFMQRAQEVARPVGNRFCAAMLMIDVDNMQNLNDTFGWAAGDKVLSSLAQALHNSFRNAELIGRVGGSKFAVIVENLEDFHLERLAKQVIDDVAQTQQRAGNQQFFVTCSGGISSLEVGMDLRKWLASAQEGVKSAKAEGGNKVVIHRASRAAWT